MNLFWHRIFKIPQTYLLVIGIILGLGAFLHWVGLRPLTLIAGGLISLGMMGFWLKFLYPIVNATKVNILDTDNFLQQVKLISNKLENKTSLIWKEAETYAKQSQQFCQNIANKESTLIPELIETLYTVLDLSSQVIKAILALEQVQTEMYRSLAQEHLNTSLTQLKNTYNQLQQLQDQILLSTLENPEMNNRLPLFLQELINENRSTLENIVHNTQTNGDSQ